jgi:hypothetical protein
MNPRNGFLGAAPQEVIAALLLQAIMSGQDTQQRFEAAEQAQADDDVCELTNEPIGYELLARHRTLDIALYAQESGSTQLLLVEGNVIQFPGEHPELTFRRFSALNEYESIYAIIDAVYPDEFDEDPNADDANFMGVYKEGKDGNRNLLVIWDLVITRDELGDEYQAWVDSIVEEEVQIIYADTREELPNVYPE